MSRETRDRPVIFRVSDSEYERMLAASGSSRSLSEFIREAVLRQLDGGTIEQQVSDIRRVVAVLVRRAEATASVDSAAD